MSEAEFWIAMVVIAICFLVVLIPLESEDPAAARKRPYRWDGK